MSMTFTLDEDQEGIRESAHEFARDVIRPAAPHHDATGEYPWEVLTQAFDAGLMNLHIPEKYDGGGFSHLDSLLVAEEMAWDVPVLEPPWKPTVWHKRQFSLVVMKCLSRNILLRWEKISKMVVR